MRLSTAATVLLLALACPAFAEGSFETSLNAAAQALLSQAAGVRSAIMLRTPVLNAYLPAPPPGTSAAVAACLRDPGCGRPFAVAHRALGFAAPENSVDGVRRAVRAGIALIETDLRLTADGAWVMLHDSTLDRTTTMSGPVARRTAAELAGARLSNGERLPRFEDLYAVSRGRAILILDLKTDAAEAVADWLSRHGSFDDVLFFASDAATLASCARARARHPAMLVMARVEAGLSWETAAAAYGGKLPLLVHPNAVAPGLARALRRSGSKIYATLVGADVVPLWRGAAARLLVSRGAVLIDTDNPAWLQSFLGGPPASAEVL